MNISKRKIRVLHIISGEFFAGAERVQDLLALCLPDYGYEIGFVCLKRGKFPVSRSSTVPLFETPMKSRVDLTSAWKIARIVKRDGYTLLHTHTPRTAMVGRVAAWLARVPMVHHIHSPTERDTESVWRNRINLVIEKLSLSSIAQLITVSQSLSMCLIKQGWSPQKITTVANGVTILEPLPDISFPGPEWVIGCIALFRPRKGIEVLIEAVAKLHQAGQPVRLRLVGPFETIEYKAAIITLVKHLGINSIIDWIDFTQDVNVELSKMDVFVLPSLFGEGMPMAILEAMASGIPVIASDVEGVSEVLTQGRTGLVVPAGDVRSLMIALADLIDGKYDWRGMREEAYRVQVERFSDRSMAKGVAHVYDETLGI